jgi:hypothetical protein
MPHAREVRATSHADHDPILVAAFAADDLAASDRDLAADLVRSCAECALLHDDLRALARATKAAPPPVAARPRDFRLTPADAARLRPAGWRRLAAAFGQPRAGWSRNLGVGLATLGLAGLLVGNVPVQLGASAARPESPSAAGAAAGQEAAPSGTTRDLGASYGGEPAASSAPVNAVPGAVESGYAPMTTDPDPDAAAASTPRPGDPLDAGAIPAASAGGKATADGRSAADPTILAARTDAEPARPLNVVFGTALVIGLALVVVSLLRRRPTV